MLGQMVTKGKQEKWDDANNFQKQKHVCDDTTVSTKRSISDNADLMAGLSAKITKGTSDIASLAADIAKYDADTQALKKAIVSAQAERDYEKATYKNLRQNYTESIRSVAQAMDLLHKKKHTHDQLDKHGYKMKATTLLQIETLRNSHVDPKITDKVLSFLQDEKPHRKPVSAGYDSQSGGIVMMLKKMKFKFQNERDKADAE